MVSLDTVFELLTNERRRYALYYLKEQNRPVSVDELADAIAEWEATPEKANQPTGFDTIQIELHHTHLPKAAEVEFIEFKPDAGLVEVQGPPPTFDALASVARVIERPAEE